MPKEIRCGQCGEMLESCPCRHCGWVAELTAGGGLALAGMRAGGQAEVFTYPEWLLKIAESLIDQDHPEVAIVTAAMACEIAVEQALSRAYKSRGQDNQDETAYGSLNGHNIFNKQVRKVYTELTGDHIEQESFWPNFTEVPKRRNRAIHAGMRFSKVEAEDSVSAARALVNHVGKVMTS